MTNAINLKNVEEIAKKFGTIAELNKELKRVASLKSRLKTLKYSRDYDKKMTQILQTEQVLKEAKALLEPKGKPVTQYTQADVLILDYDSTQKALKSIQSKKCLSKAGYDADKDAERLANDPEFQPYRDACLIEEMLRVHLATLKPVDNAVKKKDLQAILDTIENNKDLSQERILELLKGLM